MCNQPNYFYISEFERSETAQRLGINNKIPNGLISNLNRLIVETLNPARKTLGVPICVNSGYRHPKLNAAVGGAKNSYHMQARAADIVPRPTRDNILRNCPDLLPDEIPPYYLGKLYEILQKLPHKELIKYKTFIHVAL